MKNLKLIVIIFAFSTTVACNKEYTCTCTDDQTGEIRNVSVLDLSEANAQSACENADAEVGVSCVLDEV